MTLREAIDKTKNEYDQEVRSFRGTQLERRAANILTSELDQIAESSLIHDITQGRKIFPDENRAMIETWIILAFRFGMRVQRKLDHPNETTRMDWRTQ